MRFPSFGNGKSTTPAAAAPAGGLTLEAARERVVEAMRALGTAQERHRAVKARFADDVVPEPRELRDARAALEQAADVLDAARGAELAIAVSEARESRAGDLYTAQAAALDLRVAWTEAATHYYRLVLAAVRMQRAARELRELGGFDVPQLEGLGWSSDAVKTWQSAGERELTALEDQIKRELVALGQKPLETSPVASGARA